MRVRAKKPLGLEDEEAAGFLEEPVPMQGPVLPYRLVCPVAGLPPQPAVVVAVNARVREKGQPLPPTALEVDVALLQQQQPWLLQHAGSNSNLLPPGALPPVPAAVTAASPKAALPRRAARAAVKAAAAAQAAVAATVAADRAVPAADEPPAAALPPPAKPDAAKPAAAAPPRTAKPAAAASQAAATKPAAALAAAAGAAPLPPPESVPIPAARPAAIAPEAGAASRGGRPTRKRKQTSMGEDMIPPDAILRPFTKPKHAPDATATTKSRSAPASEEPPSRPAASAKPPVPPKAAAAASRAPGGKQPAMKQAEAAAQQPQLKPLPSPPPPPPARPPYSMVAPGMPLRPAPVVVLAGTADIVHLARQQEEEERRRAAAAADAAAAAALADATVMVRVVPPVGRASRAGAGKGIKQEREKVAVGRQRPPRPSRRSTPEPSAQQGGAAALQSGPWHPGMELHGGVMYVDTMRAAAAKPPPAVVVGTPPRWQQVPVRQLGIEEFSEDPVRASLEFIKHMARTAGRQTLYAGQLQQAVNAEQRLYKERLQRALVARDGRRFQPLAQEGTRRSTRNRQAPQVFLPTTTAQQTARRLRVVVTAEPEDQTATRMGKEFQALLPQLRPRPASPTPDEARWLEELVMEPHAPDLPLPPLEQLAWMAAASETERAAWVESSQRQLSAAVGSLAAMQLGLETMGGCIGASWTEEEEAALAAGMRAYGRDFHAIQQDYVPSRSVHDLVDYYYNVLKLHATEAAVQWYQEKAQAAVERQAELERAEAAREAEVVRKQERQDNIVKKRQLRESLNWLRLAARAPKEAEKMNRTSVRDRAARAAKVIRSIRALEGQ